MPSTSSRRPRAAAEPLSAFRAGSPTPIAVRRRRRTPSGSDRSWTPPGPRSIGSRRTPRPSSERDHGRRPGSRQDDRARPRGRRCLRARDRPPAQGGVAEDRASIEAVRAAVLEAIGQPSDGSPIAGRRWTARYAARRIAWHALDHAWEMEDRTSRDDADRPPLDHEPRARPPGRSASGPGAPHARQDRWPPPRRRSRRPRLPAGGTLVADTRIAVGLGQLGAAGFRISGWWAKVGGAGRPSSRPSRICAAVASRRSSPRTTSETPGAGRRRRPRTP